MDEITEYAKALEDLRVLAQRELAWWWKRTPTDTWPAKLDMMSEPFVAITQEFGEQAAAEAVDHMIMRRSLDEELRFLRAPDMAKPASQQQALGSLRWAVAAQDAGADHLAEAGLAHRKAAGVLNRLVLQPARDTVVENVRRDGTAYARVTEPGACAFCLMLASRGATYTRDTALQNEDGQRYHDNCRCLAIEVKSDADLPQLNKDLEHEWDSYANSVAGRGDPTLAGWKEHIELRRTAARNSRDFPAVQGVSPLTWKGDGTTTMFGSAENLPDPKQMAGHTLFGWKTTDTTPAWVEDPSHGHTGRSTEPGKTLFPKSWSNKDIVDALQQTMDAPDSSSATASARQLEKTVGGVKVRVKWRMVNGEPQHVFAYPVSGEGVTKNPKKKR